MVVEQVDELPVLDRDALGPAGRTGGVDDVGSVSRTRPAGQLGVSEATVAVSVQLLQDSGIVERDPSNPGRQRDASTRQYDPTGQRGPSGREGQDRGRVVQHERDPVGRQVRVDGQVHATRFQHRQQRHDHLGRPGQSQRHHPFRPGAAPHEQPGEPVRPRVELPVRQRGVPAHQGGGVRGAVHLSLEQFTEGPGREVGVGVVPLPQYLVAFGGAEQVQLAEPAAGGGGDRVEQPEQVPGHPLDGRGVEQVGVVLHEPRQGSGPPLELHGQVHSGRPARQLDLLDAQTAQARGGAALVVQQHHHVEQRIAAGITGRAGRLHQPFERHVVVGERVQGGAADLGQQVGEGAQLVHPRAQHHRVDEEAHQPFQLRAVAPGDHRAERDVVLPGVAGEQQRAGGGQGGEEGRVVGAGQLPQAVRDSGGHGEPVHRAVRGADRGARPVGGQLQRLQTGEPAGPVVGVLAGFLAGGPGALPDREVRVPQGRLGQVAGSAVVGGLVQSGEVLDQDAHRPAVGDDVVSGQQQHVLLLGQAEHRDAEQRARSQVEGHRVRLVQRLLQLGAGGQIDQRDVEVRYRVHDLHCRAVDVVEGGAQRLVPGGQRPYRGGQRRPVELTAEPHGERAVVFGLAGLEAVQEPEPLLGERER
ncbi:hypothetical protein GCM10022629_85050 [Amorphoplanes auranticolor]